MGGLYENIAGLCTDRGITAYKLCTDLGMRNSVISDLKTGRKKGLNAETLSKIADYFGVSVDYLLGNEQKEKAPADSGGRFREDELIRLDADSMEILRAVRERPDLKIMFSVGKNVTPDDLIKAIKIVEAFKEESEPKEE